MVIKGTDGTYYICDNQLHYRFRILKDTLAAIAQNADISGAKEKLQRLLQTHQFFQTLIFSIRHSGSKLLKIAGYLLIVPNAQRLIQTLIYMAIFFPLGVIAGQITADLKHRRAMLTAIWFLKSGCDFMCSDIDTKKVDASCLVIQKQIAEIMEDKKRINKMLKKTNETLSTLRGGFCNNRLLSSQCDTEKCRQLLESLGMFNSADKPVTSIVQRGAKRLASIKFKRLNRVKHLRDLVSDNSQVGDFAVDKIKRKVKVSLF